MKIRAYEPKDKEAVQAICIDQSDHPMLLNPQIREALRRVYCDYYLEQEPENCLVAEDESGKIQGYVVCAKDFAKYETCLREKYKTDAGRAVNMMVENSIASIQFFAKDYPAHLYINVTREWQRKGTGRALLIALCDKLRAEGVKGLMMDVSNYNTGAMRFYENCGFRRLDMGEQETAYGITLIERE